MPLLCHLLSLDLSGSIDKIIAEYIWIGGNGREIRSKARTLPGPVSDLGEIPTWNFDGTSTGQASKHGGEVILRPQEIFKDPFRRGNNILVLCDTYGPEGDPLPSNKRFHAAEVFSHPAVVAEEPWFGIEQEYTLLQKDHHWPLGWPTGGYPSPQGPYYCGVGANKAFGRDISDTHYKASLYAGVNICGTNAEVMPGQWEFQIGPTVGISASDELWVARYILERITEAAGVILSLDAKPIQVLLQES
ncbi:glutamine synthetase nodule isozyme-like isoform X2 [Aristolochia californica]|uniref:glutamine synthetase nodule isozyme-like isoform X2 n=1 Tax=Aristolochia californica TaxID=171875 RepID=UPI0035DA7884